MLLEGAQKINTGLKLKTAATHRTNQSERRWALFPKEGSPKGEKQSLGALRSSAEVSVLHPAANVSQRMSLITLWIVVCQKEYTVFSEVKEEVALIQIADVRLFIWGVYLERKSIPADGGGKGQGKQEVIPCKAVAGLVGKCLRFLSKKEADSFCGIWPSLENVGMRS